MNKKMWRAGALVSALLGVALSGSQALAQAKTEIALSRQPGIFYTPSHIMEKNKLIEKHAAALGLAGITTKWLTFNSGGAQTDALLAGGVDILNTGTGNLLLLWDRTRGGVKGIVATSAQPMTLISRDANIKSLKDIGPNDKIAVPTVKVSTQAIVLQIAAGELFGATSGQSWTPTPCSLAIPMPMWRCPIRSTRFAITSRFRRSPSSS